MFQRGNLFDRLNRFEAPKKTKVMNPKIHVRAHTAFAMFGEKEKALAEGCDEFIAKPIDLQFPGESVIKYSQEL